MCNALEELKLEGKQEGIEEGTVYFLVVPFDDRFLFPCDYFRWSNLPGGGFSPFPWSDFNVRERKNHSS